MRSGGGYYPPESVAIGKFFVAEIVSYDEVRLSIDKTTVPAHPTAGAWLELTLTRNPLGDPVTNLDGSLIARYDTTAVTGWQTYRDAGLNPGTWMHYGLFARYSFGGIMKWVRIATQAVLLPIEYSYKDRLYNKIPFWYRDADEASGEKLVGKLLDAVGMETDITRTWVETLGQVWEPARVPAHMLRYLSEVFGLRYEHSVGDARVRKLLANLVYLRKLKGTKEAIEGYITALSGYKVLAHQGPNRMPTVEDGEFRQGIGRWDAIDADTTLSRISVIAGGAPPAPLGVLDIKRTGTTGVAGAVLSSGPNTDRVRIASGTSRQFAVSFNARTSTGSMNAVVTLDFYNQAGTYLSSVASAGLGCTTTFGRKLTAWLAVPDTARYLTVKFTTPSIAANDSLQVGQIMLVDRRYRPDGMPGSTNTEPFSEAGSASYAGYDFYDSPRTEWINVYPQRTNFAVNSNFALNNLPAGGWSVVDAPTYGSLPFAYASYTAVAATETDYADLEEGFDSITPTWTITFDTANSRLALNSSTTGPRIAQVRSQAFPVQEGWAYCAAAEMRSNVSGTKATFRIQWMLADDSLQPLLDGDGIPVVSEGSTFDLNTTDNVRVDIRNAIAPEGAGYGRLVVETVNVATHISYMQWALIEDTAVPGPYFNGTVTEGAYGDFGFTGVAHQSPSVYYLNYSVMLGSGSNRILTASTEMLPIHVNEPRITDAYSGLYDELA